MTLHEAIIQVLQEANAPLSAVEIVQKVNDHKLYIRKDGNPVPVNQIYARVKNYPSIFYQDKGLISLNSTYDNKKDSPDDKHLSNDYWNFINQVYTINKNHDKINLSDIDWSNISSIPNANNDEYLNSSRKNIILQIKQEIRKSFGDKIGVLNNEGLKVAVAASLIYEENSHPSKSFRNQIAHHKGQDRLAFYSNNEDIIGLSSRLIAWIEIYLSTFKVFKGKDLVQFYLDLIKDWGLIWEQATPQWISTLIARLANTKVDDKVWDPATGTGRTLLEVLELNPFIEINGCEINSDVYKLAKAVLKLEKVPNEGIINCDAILTESKQFDVVISDPPKGVIRITDSKGRLKAAGNGSVLFLNKMIESTVSRGTIISIVSDGLLVNESGLKSRERILKDTWIQAVISLPLPSFGPHSGASNSLILLKKKGDEIQEPFKCRFINSDGIIKEIKTDFPRMNEEEVYNELVDKIVNLVQNQISTFPEYLVELSHSELTSEKPLSAKYHLSFSSELTRELEEKGENLFPLSAILTTAKTILQRDPKSKEGIYIIQPRDLYSKTNIRDLIQNPEKVDQSMHNSPYKILEESAILVNRRVEYFAPTYVELDKNKVGLNLNIFAFHWNQRLVFPEYVVYQLNTDLFKKQLEAVSTGGIFPYIQKNLLMNLKIPVPSLSEQYEIISKTEKGKIERSEIVKFISQIQLVETRDQLKKELERYVQENHFHNGNPRFQTEMDFKVFPFTPDEIQKNTWFKLSDDKHFAYILLLSDKQVLGVLILENVDRINFEVYSEINTYAEFLFKLTRHILSSTASSNLAKFAHTTKNFLLNLHEPLKAIANTQNQELKDLLSRHYIDTEEAIDLMIKGGEGKKEDFLAINVLQDALKRISLYTSFFKKISEIYHQIVKDNLERINIIDIIRAADTDKAVQILDDKQSVFVYGKHKSILLAFTDLIQNACKYSPDRKCKIQVVEEIYHVEIVISNKVKENCMMDKEFYENLGKDWVTRDSGTGTGSGFFSARQSIEDSNGELHKAPFEEYVMNKEFKIVIKLKTN